MCSLVGWGGVTGNTVFVLGQASPRAQPVALKAGLAQSSTPHGPHEVTAANLSSMFSMPQEPSGTQPFPLVTGQPSWDMSCGHVLPQVPAALLSAIPTLSTQPALGMAIMPQ